MFDYVLGIIAFAVLGILINAIKILREYSAGSFSSSGVSGKSKARA